MKHDRWNEILSLIKEEEQIGVHELAEHFNVSLATIRRDLQEMEDNAMIERFHGGARVNSTNISELPMIVKLNKNTPAKTLVAKYAGRLIKDNQMVYLDSGSTIYHMIDFIYAKNITVVAAGIPHITKLLNKKINTIVLGGTIKASTNTITGSKVLKQLDDYYFDIAFLGTNGIHSQAGFSTTNDDEALVKQKVISRSNISYSLADHSKFNVICAYPYAKIGDSHIITDTIGDFPADKIINCTELGEQ